MNLVNRVKGILLSPKTEWPTIEPETQNISKLITSYVLPLAIISAAANFVGYGLLGKSATISLGVYNAIVALITAFVSVFVSSFVVDALAPTFASEKNLNKSAQLVVYSSTPAMVGGLLNVFPPLAIVGLLLGLYGIYIWYLGLGPIKKTPEDKRVSYLVVSILVLIVVNFVIGFILGMLLLPVFAVTAIAAA